VPLWVLDASAATIAEGLINACIAHPKGRMKSAICAITDVNNYADVHFREIAERTVVMSCV
jgi:hypothetical protein